MSKEKKQFKIDKHSLPEAWPLLLVSLVLVIDTVMMLFVPDMSAEYFVYVGAALCLAIGIVQIAIYFMRGRFRVISNYGFAVGIFLIILGISFMMQAKELSLYAHVLIGIMVLVVGVIELQHAIQIRVMQWKYWYISIIFALATIVFASLILMGAIKSFEGNVVAYAFTLVFSILGIASMIMVMIAIRRYRKMISVEAAVKADVEYVEDAPRITQAAGPETVQEVTPEVVNEPEQGPNSDQAGGFQQDQNPQ